MIEPPNEHRMAIPLPVNVLAPPVDEALPDKDTLALLIRLRPRLLLSRVLKKMSAPLPKRTVTPRRWSEMVLPRAALLPPMRA